MTPQENLRLQCLQLAASFAPHGDSSRCMAIARDMHSFVTQPPRKAKPFCQSPPRPVLVAPTEGGEWVTWDEWWSLNRAAGGSISRLHTIAFDNGWEFDSYNGWRESPPARRA